MIIIICILCLAYVITILWFVSGMNKLPKFQALPQAPQTGFSMVIPFRDEQDHLPDLLQSIGRLQYPLENFEVLLVDDASSDASVPLIQVFQKQHPQLNIRILENDRQSGSPKKDAIQTAVKAGIFPWIITTDADCLLPEKWLKTMDAYITQHQAVFVAGPVSYSEQKGFIHQFQQLDWMSLTGVTIGSFGWKKPLLCSGANIAYNKEAFWAVEGFKGNDQIAGGDDVFLLQKMQKAYPKQVLFLNSQEARVQTKSESSWHTLLQQRIRWAGKTGKIPNRLLHAIGSIVLLFNMSLVFLVIRVLFRADVWPFLGVLFGVKSITDAFLLIKVAKNLGQKFPYTAWFFSNLVYPLFSVLVVFLSFFFKYNWKGRRFSK